MTPEQELAELRSKVEEFRKELTQDVTSFRDRWSTGGDRKFIEGCIAEGEIIIGKFCSLFPPPKKGCWGFFADRSNLTRARVLCVFDTQYEAIKMRTTSGYAPFNPGPVIFIEEPQP